MSFYIPFYLQIITSSKLNTGWLFKCPQFGFLRFSTLITSASELESSISLAGSDSTSASSGRGIKERGRVDREGVDYSREVRMVGGGAIIRGRRLFEILLPMGAINRERPLLEEIRYDDIVT